MAVGCSQAPESMFTHQGEVMAQARGLVLSADGQEGMAGMYGTTCVFETDHGRMGEDFDLEGDDEVVEDSSASGIVLTRSETGIHEVAPYGGGFGAADDPATWQFEPGDDSAFHSTELDGVVAARWLGENPVALAMTLGTCTLHGLGDLAFRVELQADVCLGYRDMAINHTTAEVFVGGDAGIVAIQGRTTRLLAEAAVEAMSWDVASQAMYVTVDEGQTLQALDATGTVRWERASTGTTAMTHLGELGAVATMERDLAGRGVLAVFDGQTGETLSRVPTPSSGFDMAISGNGETLAIAVDQFIHLFSVHGGSR
jgi:hypothetical protein